MVLDFLISFAEGIGIMKKSWEHLVEKKRGSSQHVIISPPGVEKLKAHRMRTHFYPQQ
jgi:hypothetical protein